jgi:hypothetical protein
VAEVTVQEIEKVWHRTCLRVWQIDGGSVNFQWRSVRGRRIRLP